MKKPTKEDLERIRAELQEMLDYMQDNYPVSKARQTSDWVADALIVAIEQIEEIILDLPNLRDNVISDC